MEKLKLNELDCCIASDLKLINALLGISSHSGKFSCPYCTGDMSLESGELRTYESLAKHHDDFVAKGSKMKDMKKVGLGIFCEQTCESSHCVLKPTVQRFKRKVDHRDHGPRLLRAVVDFSSKAV